MFREFANPMFARMTPSGLRYVLVQPGTGALSSPNVAVVQYVLCRTDGTMIEASAPNAPFAFSIGQRQVIRGFEEAVRLAGRGGRIDAYLPYQLAYGSKGSPPAIEPKMTLLFAIDVTRSAPIGLSTILRRALERGGVPEMQRAYRAASAKHFAGMYAAEDDTQLAGYSLLKHHKYSWAIALFTIETARFPKSAEAYALLGEANGRAGKRQAAIAAFSTALRLNPKDKTSAAALKALRAARK
jgi:tetratricopeptide (TPR) repeat protein